MILKDGISFPHMLSIYFENTNCETPNEIPTNYGLTRMIKTQVFDGDTEHVRKIQRIFAIVGINCV